MAEFMSTEVPTTAQNVMTSHQPWWRTRHGMTAIKHSVTYLVLCVCSLIFLAPFLWQLSAALKPEYEISVFPPQWMPQPIMWSNFTTAFTEAPFNIFFKNTMVIEAGVIAGTIISCTMVAYAFARLQAPGKNILFGLVLSTMMLPGAVTLIPTYVIFVNLHWVNTLLPLIVPAWFGNPFYIFLLRQFFRTIPVELEESARIDGANIWHIIWRIFVPLSKPALATVVVFTFVGVWQDFLNPLIYLNSTNNFTLALGLTMFQDQYKVDWNLTMAATTALTVPVLLLFFFAQRYFIEGITLTGLKG